jgi:hypothetical protein
MVAAEAGAAEDVRMKRVGTALGAGLAPIEAADGGKPLPPKEP